nr:S1C family serine protease [Spirochaetota bacterium]
MKYLYVFTILVIFTSSAFSYEEKDDFSHNRYSFVVNICNGIRLESNLFSDPDFVIRINEESEIKFLNVYLALRRVSGVVITADGYILTSGLVGDEKDILEVKRKILSEIKYSLNKLKNNVSAVQLQKLVMELDYLLMNQKSQIVVALSNGKLYDAKLIEKDKDSEIELLKINSKFLNYAKIRKKSRISIGDEVNVAGYKNDEKFIKNFDDLNLITSKGVVTALRDGIGGIQHSAKYDYDLMGSPLFDSLGYLVGINTYEWEKSQYSFSTNINLFKDFLSDYKLEDIVGLEFSEDYDFINSSKYFFPIITEGYDIFLNGEFCSQSPTLITLKEGENSVKIENEEYFSEITLFSDVKDSKVTKIKPVFKNKKESETRIPEETKTVLEDGITQYGKLFFPNLTNDSNLYIDGVLMVSENLESFQIGVGEHKIVVLRVGYIPYEKMARVEDGKNVKIVVEYKPKEKESLFSSNTKGSFSKFNLLQRAGLYLLPTGIVSSVLSLPFIIAPIAYSFDPGYVITVANMNFDEYVNFKRPYLGLFWTGVGLFILGQIFMISGFILIYYPYAKNKIKSKLSFNLNG